jgi:hypothetical protein
MLHTCTNYIFTHLPTYILPRGIHLPIYLPTHPPTYLLTYPPTHPPPTYPPTYALTHLSPITYLPLYLIVLQ